MIVINNVFHWLGAVSERFYRRHIVPLVFLFHYVLILFFFFVLFEWEIFFFFAIDNK